MNPVQFYASVAHQVLSAANAPSPSAPTALEITPVAPFDFSYTKVRLDTGEAVWRWPRETPASTPKAAGDLVDIVA
jgi:hypothetical protein